MASVPIRKTPPQTQPESVEERFNRLAAAWNQAVGHQSSVSVRNNHPAYQEIIRLGPDVIPFLLRDLEQNQTHWFFALRTLTGANPVEQAHAGNIHKMAEAWLRWAKENGLQW